MRHRGRHGPEWGFGPWEFWTGFGAGPRRRRRRQWFESGDMKYVILSLLRDKAMHGYEVMRALEEQTHGCYKPSPGTVYPTLQWLEDEGLVMSEERDGKKVYSVTDEGLEFLDRNQGTVDDIFERIGDTIERFVGGPMPEINLAFGRLATQVYRVAWKLGSDESKKKKIAEILDRATADLSALVP